MYVDIVGRGTIGFPPSPILYHGSIRGTLASISYEDTRMGTTFALPYCPLVDIDKRYSAIHKGMQITSIQLLIYTHRYYYGHTEGILYTYTLTKLALKKIHLGAGGAAPVCVRSPNTM